MKTSVLFRLGGVGDILILTVVAKELKKLGYEVDGCFGSPTGDMVKFLEPTGIFRKIIPQTRWVSGADVYKVNEKDWATTGILKTQYDWPVEFKFAIELNSHYKQLANKPGMEWILHQNSNYVNWVDMMLAWANIDPSIVKDDDKIPEYVVLPIERYWAESILRIRPNVKIISIQTNASSLVRTWYHPQRLPDSIRAEWPIGGEKEVDIIVFDGVNWQVLRGKHVFPIKIPDGIDPLRASAAIIGVSDLFIGADSGFSHVAEALKVKSITIYTTVPAWTRMKYYKYAKAIEPIGNTFDSVTCRPCFVLDRYCPRIRERAIKELTPREQKIKSFVEAGVAVQNASQGLNTTPQGAVKEWEMAQHRLNALLEMQAPCSETITTERIMELVRNELT